MPLADAPRRPTRRSSGPRRRSRRGGAWRRATGPGCCAGSPPLVDEHVEELAALEVRNSGHTIGNARWEAGNVRDVLDYYAGGAGAAVRAGRSRCPAGWTSRSTSRSASSA